MKIPINLNQQLSSVYCSLFFHFTKHLLSNYKLSEVDLMGNEDALKFLNRH